MKNQILKQTPLTKLKRGPQRGVFERSSINRILDASPLCHLGHQTSGKNVVIPTIHWRVGDRIYWHGSRISRAIKESERQNVCLTVTLLDGLVLARSAISHSANYRSVMIFGTPDIVDDAVEKTQLLKLMIDGLFPDRWDQLRTMTRKELNATTILSLPISEASAKVRTGGPGDIERDGDFPVWTGVIPVSQTVGGSIPCDGLLAGLDEPGYVREYTIG